MKNEKTTATRRNPLLPLIALVVGLCVPIYAFATGMPDNDCEQCHLACSSSQQIAMFMAECGGSGSPGFNQCMSYKVAQCHTTCWQGVCMY